MRGTKNKLRSLPWLTLGMGSIFLCSLLLRFWGLSRFNTLVFDEVYYAKFGNNYLTQTPFFNSHPPLSQYLIAFGIWLGSHLPFGKETVNDLAGSVLTPWSYRWLNAFTGSFIPLVVGAIAYQLTHRRSYSLLATLLIASDGFFLVESRYALSNIYIVILGLLAQLFFIISLKNTPSKQWFWLIVSGIFLGFTTAAKWNGLGFVLGLYLLIALAWLVRLVTSRKRRPETALNFHSPLQNITQITAFQLLFCLVFIPIVVYFLTWIPHLQQNPEPGLWEIQTKILNFHKNLGDGSDIHPYCSEWYTWVFLIRPIAYFYKKVEPNISPDPILPPLDPQTTPIIYDVHALGNPFLWWFSALASFLFMGMLLQRIWMHFRTPTISKPFLSFLQFPSAPELWLAAYLVINWLANWLPWAKVSRCVFLYHYMSAFVFTCMALAWWLERWIYSDQKPWKIIGITAVLIILFAYIFWMPVYLGLPLSTEAWRLRMWFNSWV